LALVAEFARRQRYAILTATREATTVQLNRFAFQLAAATDQPLISTLTNWFDALVTAGTLADEEPLLVAIDEVPYLDEADAAFGSAVQAHSSSVKSELRGLHDEVADADTKAISGLLRPPRSFAPAPGPKNDEELRVVVAVQRVRMRP
jgi:hypothetical protein